MSSLRRFSVSLAALGALLACLLVQCSRTSSHTITLQLWHFWSEPAQQHAFENLIHEFEQTHPNIHVQCTPLQWSDGKAKLQTAFASHTAPDVIHIGLEWVPEFAQAGVLDTIAARGLDGAPNALARCLQTPHGCYAMPWVMNTRAIFVLHSLLKGNQQNRREVSDKSSLVAAHKPEVQTLASLYQLLQSDPQGSFAHPAGVNAYEPHNVLKKTLPVLWSSGSGIFKSLPYSASIDDKAEIALQRYVDFCQHGRMEGSRQLDEAMKRAELGVWCSGMWSISASLDSLYDVLPYWPALDSASMNADKGGSILSADCFAISQRSAHKQAAQELLEYIASAKVEEEFCARIPDAGFPVHARPTEAFDVNMTSRHSSAHDSLWQRSSNSNAFYLLCLRSQPLPMSTQFLEAEGMYEEQIMQALYGKKSAHDALDDLRKNLRTLEESSAKAPA